MQIRYSIEEYESGKITKGITELPDDMLFPQAVEEIVKSEKIKFGQLSFYDLVEKTFGKVLSIEFAENELGLDNCHYYWLKWNLKIISDAFNLFDDELTIIVEGLGIGAELGYSEGIKFIIHSNEKDKHGKFPHVHACYGDEELFVYLKDLSTKDNKKFKSKKKTKVALKWIENNKIILLKYWNSNIENIEIEKFL